MGDFACLSPIVQLDGNDDWPNGAGVVVPGLNPYAPVFVGGQLASDCGGVSIYEDVPQLECSKKLPMEQGSRRSSEEDPPSKSVSAL